VRHPVRFVLLAGFMSQIHRFSDLRVWLILFSSTSIVLLPIDRSASFSELESFFCFVCG
jgi:hypothetical protein